MNESLIAEDEDDDLLSGPHSGKPGTYTIESQTSVVRHTESGDEILIGRRDVQPDAPMTTVIAREALAPLCDLVMLSLGCTAAAIELQGPQKDWILRVGSESRRMARELVDVISGSVEKVEVQGCGKTDTKDT